MIKQLLTLALIPSLLHGGGGCSKTAAPKNTERKNAVALSPNRKKQLVHFNTINITPKQQVYTIEQSKAVTTTSVTPSATPPLATMLNNPNITPRASTVAISITTQGKKKKKTVTIHASSTAHDGKHIPSYSSHHAQSPSTYQNPLIEALGNKPKINTQQSVDMTYNNQLGN